MTDEPFGRQKLPVTVVIEGDPVDVDYWRHQLQAFVENRAATQTMSKDSFKIYPRANND